MLERQNESLCSLLLIVSIGWRRVVASADAANALSRLMRASWLIAGRPIAGRLNPHAAGASSSPAKAVRWARVITTSGRAVLAEARDDTPTVRDQHHSYN